MTDRLLTPRVWNGVISPDWSQFDPKLLAANIALREQEPDSQVKLHPHRCGPCADCVDHLGPERAVALKLPDKWANISLEQFVRHAELYGVDCVAETAGAYLTASEMDRLRIELDSIEAARKVGWFKTAKRRRRSELETARYARALAQELADEGLGETTIEHRIADKLGISDAYTRRVLKLGREMSDTPQNAPRNPSVQAGKSATKRESGRAVPPTELVSRGTRG